MDGILMNAITHLSARLIAVLAVALALAPVSCGIRVIDASSVLDDFRTEGFLDPDHFQVIVRGAPAPGARGLVARRESALKAAESRIPEAVADAVGTYRLECLLRRLEPADRPLVTNLEQVRAELWKEAAGYVRYGRRAFEYYNEDHSAVIVYRIYRGGLRASFESGGPKLALPEPHRATDTSPTKG